jgi:hypothetical protein
VSAGFIIWIKKRISLTTKVRLQNQTFKVQLQKLNKTQKVQLRNTAKKPSYKVKTLWSSNIALTK